MPVLGAPWSSREADVSRTVPLLACSCSGRQIDSLLDIVVGVVKFVQLYRVRVGLVIMIGKAQQFGGYIWAVRRRFWCIIAPLCVQRQVRSHVAEVCESVQLLDYANCSCLNWSCRHEYINSTAHGHIVWPPAADDLTFHPCNYDP